MKAYTPETYRFVAETSASSAEVVVPRVMGWLRPRSVVDFGCGTGEWLAAFRAAGVPRVFGLDGPWVPRPQLVIAEADFRPADLCRPVRLDERFDLALCLEVMGHVPRPADETLLDSVTDSAAAVLFSAPIPGQGGIGGKANNRDWPAHWARKLRERGFVPIDCVRPIVWDDPNVAWWFAQNMFLAIHETALPRFPVMARAAESSEALPRALVHPRAFESTVDAAGRLEDRPLRQLLPAVARAVLGRLGRHAGRSAYWDGGRQ